MSNDVESFLSSGGKSAKFESMGDMIAGEITDVSVQDQRNMDSGQVMTWDDGLPRKQMVISLQTDLREDDDDDGVRKVYVKGGNYTVDQGSGASGKTALQQACKKAGVKIPEAGGTLKVAFTGLGVKTNRGFSAPKLFTMSYQPPKIAASEEFLFDDE